MFDDKKLCLPDSEHSGFSANGSDFCSGAVRTKPSQQLVADVAFDRHRSSVDPENVDPAFLIGQSELDFSVQTSRTEESRIEGVGPIRGHQDFDVAAGIEAVQLKKSVFNLSF
jgi:hypothetical protein